MATFKRTGNTQTEITATGIITTAETIVRRHGKKHTRWEQIGYTSFAVDSDGKQYIDGPYGQQLIKEEEGE